jgi:hypothetical protein
VVCFIEHNVPTRKEERINFAAILKSDHFFSNAPLGKPKHRWKDNIKIDRMEMESTGVKWIHEA